MAEIFWRTAAVERMCEAAPGLIDLLGPHGVMFNRHAGRIDGIPAGDVGEGKTL